MYIVFISNYDFFIYIMVDFVFQLSTALENILNK